MRQNSKPVAAPASLSPCPETPNCVSSQAKTKAQRVAPFACSGNCKDTLARLRDLVAAMPGAKVTAFTGNYLHAEFSSALLRFVDDLELLADRNAKVIHVRSASRLGSWDLGVNRRRVESLHRRFSGSRP
jgi:uncharacterized protein (DUF1499 family)